MTLPDVTAIYKGTTPVSRVYRGTDIVWGLSTEVGLQWSDTFTRADTAYGTVGGPEVQPDSPTPDTWGDVNGYFKIKGNRLTSNYTSGAEWLNLRGNESEITTPNPFFVQWDHNGHGARSGGAIYFSCMMGTNPDINGTGVSGFPYINALWYTSYNPYGSQYYNQLNLTMRHPDGNETILVRKVPSPVVMRFERSGDNLKLWADSTLILDYTSYKVGDVIGSGMRFGVNSINAEDLDIDNWQQGEM